MAGSSQPIKRFAERFVTVRPGEWPAFLLAFGYFFCLLSGYYILRPIRDEMGVIGGTRNLQWLFTATFFAMLAAVPAFGWLVSRHPRRRFMPAVYHFFTANLLIFFLLFRLDPQNVTMARIFFVWVSVYNLFVISVFWSFLSDIFTEGQGRRLFGAIAAGGTTGALLGPLLTAGLAVPLGPVNLLLVSALLLQGAVICIRLLSRHRFRPEAASDQRIEGGILSGATTLLQSRHLMLIAAYVLFYTWTSTFLYFQQAEIVANAFDNSPERTRIFALIDLTVNFVTLILQVLVTGRLLAWGGVTAGLVLLPAFTAIGFATLAAAPAVLTLLGFQGLRRATNYAIARPGREVLFTVVPREQRYKSKNFLDTVVYRGGDAVSGWLYAGLAGLGLSLKGIALVAVPIAGLWLLLATVIGRRHERLTEEKEGEAS
ncbi:MAG: MFS transporter [Alphaproteobacteria bacterium]|nr:MFS transporter [Alphaproteobacteria bacterium]MBU0798517.1 MFS transporter [Alphaproteobacteria bacterium]MBU0886203.1 MFS transporter [Alphaproteobacteria bacterium]MBU1812843.1 MFS transporter [Alphaproteobacteria bacterium]MBU2090581.1 MFS transporter [Alphaproteobacteria bacterium]